MGPRLEQAVIITRAGRGQGNILRHDCRIAALILCVFEWGQAIDAFMATHAGCSDEVGAWQLSRGRRLERRLRDARPEERHEREVWVKTRRRAFGGSARRDERFP